MSMNLNMICGAVRDYSELPEGQHDPKVFKGLAKTFEKVIKRKKVKEQKRPAWNYIEDGKPLLGQKVIFEHTCPAFEAKVLSGIAEDHGIQVLDFDDKQMGYVFYDPKDGLTGNLVCWILYPSY